MCVNCVVCVNYGVLKYMVCINSCSIVFVNLCGVLYHSAWCVKSVRCVKVSSVCVEVPCVCVKVSSV